jgi:hypothetical protein
MLTHASQPKHVCQHKLAKPRPKADADYQNDTITFLLSLHTLDRLLQTYRACSCQFMLLHKHNRNCDAVCKASGSTSGWFDGVILPARLLSVQRLQIDLISRAFDVHCVRLRVQQANLNLH